MRFQSTRPRGARQPGAVLDGGHAIRFNPRARVGRDVEELLNLTIFSSFNPRARVGRDISWHASCVSLSAFQSTRPRGARQEHDCCASRHRQFQSTRPRGARPPTPACRPRPAAFQSTRPRGARHGVYEVNGVKLDVSIHAPAWGATLDGQRRMCRRIWFQSTRPRGARQPHHNSLRDKDFFRVTREPMLSLDPKGTGQVAATQKPMKSISC